MKMTFTPIASATTLLAFIRPPVHQNPKRLCLTKQKWHPSITSCPPSPRSVCLATAADAQTQSSSSSKYDDLVQWFLAADEDCYLSSKIEIRPSTRGGLETGGYGAFASEDVSRGELLMKIPRKCCVTLDDALNDNECGAAFQGLMKKAGPGSETVILAGYLAKEYLLLQEYERRIAEGSSPDDDSEMRRLSKIKFGPYLRTLPWKRGVNAQEHVLFWDNDYVDTLLKGSLAYEDAVEIRSSVTYATKILNGIIAPVVRKARGEGNDSDDDSGFRFPWQPKPEKESSNEILDGLEDAVRGAFVICLSRSFAAPISADIEKTEERLEPMLDLLQHSNNPNIKHGNALSGKIEVTASVDIKSGDELFNQYLGEEDENMPYHKFFTRFGFVPGVVEPLADLIADRSTIFFPQRASV